MMLQHELLQPEGILVLTPESPLGAIDFERLAQEIDPYIEASGNLRGVMIDAKSFPGWKDFAGAVAHLRFVKDHHQKIQKLAVVSDSTVLTLVPKIAGHFVQAEVRHFSPSRREEALHWLEGDNH
jgi:MFS superfamily sulfate permease-like transporter